MGFKRGNKLGGRHPGKPNKSTQEIKQIIHEAVDFRELVTKLAERAMTERDTRAAVLLFEYGFGKPVQTINATIASPDRDRARRDFSELFGVASSAFVSPSGQLVSGPEPVQDSKQGPSNGVQHGDSTRGNGQGKVPG